MLRVLSLCLSHGGGREFSSLSFQYPEYVGGLPKVTSGQGVLAPFLAASLSSERLFDGLSLFPLSSIAFCLSLNGPQMGKVSMKMLPGQHGAGHGLLACLQRMVGTGGGLSKVKWGESWQEVCMASVALQLQ